MIRTVLALLIAVAIHAAEPLAYAGSGSVAFLLRAVAPGAISGVTGGSGDALAALAEGRAALVGLSRPPTAEEDAALRAARGTAPATRLLGRSAVGLFVHRDNPCAGLTSAQLVAAMRGTLTWGELGVAGDLAARPVAVVVNHPASGATTQLVETMLGGEALPLAVRCELVGSSVVQAAAIDPAVLAVAALHQATPAVRTVTLDGIAPEPAAIADGSYRLSRPLLIAWLPRSPADPGLVALFAALDDPAATRTLAGLGVR